MLHQSALQKTVQKSSFANGDVGDKGLLEKRYLWRVSVWHKYLSPGTHYF